MKKGITPIISVIVLLLITIALAGAAWTFLNQYLSGTTGKNLQMIDSYCQGGTTAKIVLKNVGTEAINIGNCNVGMSGTETSCGDVIVVRTDGGGLNGSVLTPNTGGNTIPSQGLATFTDNNCTVTGTPKTCIYRFVVGTLGAVQAIVTCSG